jgi:hypothetical protein
VIVGQIPLNVRKTTVCPSIKNLLSNCQTLRQRFLLALRKMTLKTVPFFNFLLANKGLCCMNLCYLRLLKVMSVPMIQYAYATGKDMSHRYVGNNIIPPFITCPVGLYMNGELARLQSGGLNLKTSMLRSCSTWLQISNVICRGLFHIQ